LLAGLVARVGAIKALHAQNTKQPVYIIADVDVTDPAAYHA
jgi:hypothetical protein